MWIFLMNYLIISSHKATTVYRLAMCARYSYEINSLTIITQNLLISATDDPSFEALPQTLSACSTPKHVC